MNQNGNAMSALELYRKAWRLHYKEDNIAGACEIYQNIISDFPESDVAGYAVIQLQKVQADTATKKLARRDAPSAPLIVLLILNFILVAALAGYTGFQFWQMKGQAENAAMASRALAKMVSGNEQQALEIIGRLKTAMPDDITPYVLTAELHMKNHEFRQAYEAYRAYQRLRPDDPRAKIEMEAVRLAKKEYDLETMAATREAPEDSVKKMREKTEKTPSPQPKSRNVQSAPRNDSGPKRLVSPDSITYF